MQNSGKSFYQSMESSAANRRRSELDLKAALLSFSLASLFFVLGLVLNGLGFFAAPAYVSAQEVEIEAAPDSSIPEIVSEEVGSTESPAEAEATQPPKDPRTEGLLKQANYFLQSEKYPELLEWSASLGSSAERSIISVQIAKAVSALDTQVRQTSSALEALRLLHSYHHILPNEKLSALLDHLLHQLISLGEAQPTSLVNSFLEDSDIKSLFRMAVQSQPELRASISKLYELRIRALVQAENANPLTDAYAILLENRPDPNEANNELRLWIILNADHDNVRQFAFGRLEELRHSNSLGKIDRLKILAHGYYGKGALIFFVSSFIIVLICVALVFIRPAVISGVSDVIAKAEEQREKKATVERAAQTSGRSRSSSGGPGSSGSAHEKTVRLKRPLLSLKERSVPGYARGPVEQDEYSRLLEMLGLEDEASESDIKKAYRDRVKDLHPDAQRGQVSPQDESFIELKEVYDRILQIRASWFGGRR